MLISVDLPAPFSPMMPWMVPASTVRQTSRLACTAPKALPMWRSSMAGGLAPPAKIAPAPATGRPGEVSVDSATGTACKAPGPRAAAGGRACRLVAAAVVGGVVVDLQLAGHDVGGGLLDRRLHLLGDEVLVVLVERPADAVVREAEILDARGPIAVGSV